MTRRQRLEAVIRGEITEELIEDCKVELIQTFPYHNAPDGLHYPFNFHLH